MKTLHIATAPTKAEMLTMSLDEKLKRSSFFVEANKFEQFILWKDNYHNNKDVDKLEWVQDTSGFFREIGSIGHNKPVTVNFTFCIIGETYICFYYPSSRYVDYKMVEDWIEKNYPVKYDGDSRRAMVDAANFSTCKNFCKERFDELKTKENGIKK